jgi:large subunit ribosomal protein L23
MISEKIYKVIIAPISTEKSEISAQIANAYSFKVERTATKDEISQAVSAIFNVNVVKVHTSNVQGKQKRFGNRSGKRSDWKKAFVKLIPGQTINFSESGE